MYRIGTDIVKISRIEESMKSSHFVERVFTPDEIEYCRVPESYAGIFAAKEAYFKALGTGIDKSLTSIEILHKANNKPFLNGIEKSDVSISHDGDYAVATVILWE